MRRGSFWILAALLFTLQCVSAGGWVRSYQIAEDDTGESVRRARTCIEDTECRLLGNHTSMFGLNHGASWIRLLAHHLRRGGGLTAAQDTVLALLLAAGAISFLAARRHLSLRASLLWLLFYAQATVSSSDFPRLANSNLLPLPLALYYASAARSVESGGVLAAAAGAVFIALATSANLTSGLLLPFHVALVALFCRRWWGAVALALLAFWGTFFLESTHAARQVAALFPVRLLALCVMLAVIAAGVRALRVRVLALGSRLASAWQGWRRHLASLPLELRMRAVMKAAVVYVSLVLWIGGLASARIPGHYMAPIVFPLLFVAVEAADRLSRRAVLVLSAAGLAALVLFPFAAVTALAANGFLVLASAAVAAVVAVQCVRFRKWMLLGRDPLARAPASAAAVLAVAVLFSSLPDTLLFPRERQSWSVAPSERLARGLYEAGYTFEELAASLQRHAPLTFDGVVAMLDPRFFSERQPVTNPGWSLLALMVQPAAIARTEGVVLSFPISRTRSAIVVRAPSYLDRTRVRRCYLKSCGEKVEAGACIERHPELGVTHVPPFFQDRVEEDREPGRMYSFQPAAGPYCMVLSVPVRTPGAGVPHIVRVADQWPLEIRIERIEGVDFEGELPADEIVLEDRRAASGTIEVLVRSAGLGPDADWLADPPLIEVTRANEHLLEPFRAGRMSRL